MSDSERWIVIIQKNEAQFKTEEVRTCLRLTDVSGSHQQHIDLRLVFTSNIARCNTLGFKLNPILYVFLRCLFDFCLGKVKVTYK